MSKAVNRAAGTVAGGAVAIAVQWIAAKAGSELEPYILGASLSVLGAFITAAFPFVGKELARSALSPCNAARIINQQYNRVV